MAGNVETRSIARQITQAKHDFTTGAGDICACFASSAVYQPGVCSRFSVCDSLDRTFAAARDRAAAADLEALCAHLTVFLPPGAEETALRGLVRRMDALCAEGGAAIGTVRAEVTGCVNRILSQVTVCGIPASVRTQSVADWSDSDIVAVGCAGAEGSMLLALEREEELCARYPLRMVRAAQGFSGLLGFLPQAAAIARRDGFLGVAAGEGGVFAALWELAERAGVGMRIEGRSLPIRQETVEICNFLDLDPYRLLSGGTLVMLCRDGAVLAEELARRGIPAALAGHTTADNDRVVINGEGRRFLEPGKGDEWYRALEARGEERICEKNC